MLNIAIETSRPSRLYKKTENFAQLHELYKQAQCSDVTLQIYDEAQCAMPVEQQQCWLSVQTHKLILCANSAYFRQLLARQPAASVLRLYVSLGGIEHDMLRHFFGLFYLNVLDERHLTAEELLFLDENVLYMYKLAHFFSFDALASYCERRIFESMNVEHFKEVLNFCLIGGGDTQQLQQQQQPHRVIPERLSIYTHMLQWYKCCIEHTPYMSLTPRRNSGSDSSNESDDFSSGSSSSSSSSCNGNSPPPPQQLSVTYYSCNKEEILDEMVQAVPDLERHCLLPQKTVQYMTDFHTRLYYYRRCCHYCLNGTRTPQQMAPQCTVFSTKPSHYVNMGVIKKRYGNGHESYHFSLKRVDQDWFLEMHRTQQPLHPKKRARMQPPVVEEMHFESGGGSNNSDDCRYQCITSVELLSAKATERQEAQTPHTTGLSVPQQLCGLRLHKPKHCYVGKCDNCRNKQPLYIVVCRVDVHRTPQSNGEMEVIQQ
jgi:hypothetical protein